MAMCFDVPTRYQTQYGLLASFARQLTEGMQARGVRVNMGRRAGDAGCLLFFNNPAELSMVLDFVAAQPHPTAMINWCVDHPLTIPVEQLESLSRVPGFRLLTVCDDDTHLLALRFPGLAHATCAHGVTPSALADEARIEESFARSGGEGGREHDVILSGSIVDDAQLDRLREPVPGALRAACEQIVALRVEQPWVGFGAAYEMCLPRGLRCNDPWGLMAVVFRYTTAAVNRIRRARVVEALRPFRTALVGPPALKAFEGGGVGYLGEATYEALPSHLARARVCIALGPTQFVHGWSERILLSMGAGCVTLADDRLGVRREFGGLDAIGLFDLRDLGSMQDRVAQALADPIGSARRGELGVREVRRAHLWSHRVGTLEGVAAHAAGTIPARGNVPISA